jgi:hypothetical protein
MKKYNHPIDDFFREVLTDHQMAPSEAAKKAFLRDVMKADLAEKKGRKGLILLSAFLALVCAGIIMWAVSSSSQSKQDPTGQLSKQQLPAQTPSGQPVTVQNPEAQPAWETENPKSLNETEKPHILTPSSFTDTVVSGQNDKTVAPAFQSSYAVGTATAEQSVIPEHSPEISLADDRNQIENKTIEASLAPGIAPANPFLPDTGSAQILKKTDSLVIPVTGTKEKKQEAAVKSSKLSPSIGVYYTPEWKFNTLEGTKFVNNFGIEGTFHFGRFSVRTGAGLSIAKGTNELIVEYNDFLGAYNKLDSMDFTWNGQAHKYIPTMYISQENVWDSLMKLEYAKVIKRYTYLQIPLVMGYDFWQTDRISIGVRVGPVLSILLASKLLSAPYDPGKKRIISINDIAPEQVSLNWQAMAGLGASIRLTNSLQFEVEPSVKYYFNSVYEKPVNNAKPWSIGVRAAFVVKF